MQIYKTKAHKFAGTDFREAKKEAFGLYTEIKRKSKRRAYVKRKSSLICSGNICLTKKNGRIDSDG